MDQQTKAKLMELFSEALDKGAYVNVHFTQYDKTNGDFKPVFKNEVEDKAKEIAEMLSVEAQELNGFTVSTEHIHLCFGYVPVEEAYLEEDIWQEEEAI